MNENQQERNEPARKPGVFKVGDRVHGENSRMFGRVTELGDERGVYVTYDDRPAIPSYALAKNLRLIEPAREGEPCTTPPAGLPTPQESSPPAPSTDSVEYFRSVLWPKAPPAFPLGQRVEQVARREPCPCCDGATLGVLKPDCPECAGRGWQEVK